MSLRVTMTFLVSLKVYDQKGHRVLRCRYDPLYDPKDILTILVDLTDYDPKRSQSLEDVVTSFLTQKVTVNNLVGLT